MFTRRTPGGYGGLTRVGQLGAHERVVVVRDRASYGVVTRHARLDDDFPALGSAARASRDLAEQLEAAFRRAEVGQVDADVRIDDADERDVREIEALGDHLGAEQDVDFAAAHAVEDVGVRPFAARGVDVHARDARVRIPLEQQALDLLRA